MQFFFNSYVYKCSADLLEALHIDINSIIKIIAFFLMSNTCFTSLHCMCILSRSAFHLIRNNKK